MIIDVHTHVYPEKIVKRAIEKLEKVSGVPAKTNGIKSGLVASMREAGIDYSLLLPVATSVKQVDTINAEAAETNERAKETGLLSFGGIHTDTANYSEVLHQIKSCGLKGIKLHPDYQNTFFDDMRYKRIVEKATELGLYIMVHAGEDIGLPEPVHCRPEHVLSVLEETESDKLILAHMGGWRLWDEVEELLAGQNIYFDTSFSLDCMPGIEGMLTEEQFLRLVRKHGADKILFGSDSPWSSQKDYVDWMKRISLTEEERRLILGENARKIVELSGDML